MAVERSGVTAMAVLILLAVASAPAAGPRCGRDPAALADARAVVDGECDCTSSPTHGAYVRCAERVVQRLVSAGLIRTGCRGSIVAHAARSTCGRPGRTTTTTSTTETTTSTMPPDVCGDGECGATESCEACSADCGACRTRPELPIAAPSCLFPATCCGGDCEYPTLQLSPNAGTIAWTSFFFPGSTTTVQAFLSHPGTPCATPGAAFEIPTVTVGDSINLTNGIVGTGRTSVFGLMQCLFENNVNDREFVIPVVDLGSCSDGLNQALPVAGFVAVKLISVDLSGVPTITLQPFFRDGVPAQPGT